MAENVGLRTKHNIDYVHANDDERLDALEEGGGVDAYPDDAPPTPAPVVIGNWDWLSDWDFSGPIASGKIRNIIGDLASTNSGLGFNPIDRDGINRTPELELIENQVILLNIYENDVLTHSHSASIVFDGSFDEEWFIFWINPPNFLENISPYPSDGTKYTLSVAVAPTPPSPQKSFLKDFEVESDILGGKIPIEEINVTGKDGYAFYDMTINWEPAYSSTNDLAVEILYFTGDTNTANEYAIVPQTSFAGQDLKVKLGFMASHKLEDYDNILFIMGGIEPQVGAVITVRICDLGIKDNN